MSISRTAILDSLSTSNYDLCIIGGGATGAGCALDAASPGYKVLLIEKEDFGAGTSSKSTKLLHGGVRYLEQAIKKLSSGQYRMVKKALHERATLLKLAPHVAQPLQLVTPCRNMIEMLYYYTGLKLYDWLSGEKKIGTSQWLSRNKALGLIPTLKKKNLFGAVLYFDAQFDDLRFNLALIQTAIEFGADCINHAKAVNFSKQEAEKLNALVVVDTLSGKSYSVLSKCFINAAGPFADTIRTMANNELLPRICVSKGVHLVLPYNMMPSNAALLIPKTSDGRLMFAIPYKQHVLVGTTDDETALSENEFGPVADEIKYLLQYVNDYLDTHAKASDITSGFGGLRPLLKTEEKESSKLIRDHVVEFDAQSGLISILGGKWTTYRLMAKDTIDAVEIVIGKKKECITNSIVLTGSRNFSNKTAQALQQKNHWEADIVQHLVSKYGDKCLALGELVLNDSPLLQRILPGLPFTFAELKYVVENEWAFTVKDVLARRWGIQLTDWQQTLQLIPVVGNYLKENFGWSFQEQQLYIENYAAELKQMIAVSTENFGLANS